MGFRIDNYIEIIDPITFSEVEEPNRLKNREGRIWYNFYSAFDPFL
ncbi:MAG: hypothetical protein ACTSSG_06175 [Candidatus Heimdallarchaeaceae archaeon]